MTVSRAVIIFAALQAALIGDTSLIVGAITFHLVILIGYPTIV